MMKQYTILSLFVFSTISLMAQNDAYHNALLTQLQNDYGLTGGSWVLTPNETINANNAISYGHTVTVSSVTGQDFSQAIRMDVASAGNAPWDAGYFIPNVNTIQQGDRVLMVVWLKTVSTGTGDAGKINIFSEEAATYDKEIIFTAQPDVQWKQYLIPFEADQTYNASQLNTGFHLAYQQQIIEYGGMALINYGTSVPLSSLPTQLNLDSYPGSDPNAAWRAAADARIAQHRKSNIQVNVVDANGTAIQNATVHVEMLRHQFAFGSAVVPRRLANNTWFDATYQAKILDLDGNGHGFNWVVTENALKWDAWENEWVGTPAETTNAIQWLDNNNIGVRGHTLVWPGWGFMPSDMQANANDPTYLINRIDGRLNSMLTHPDISPIVKEWDVLNEIVHVTDLEQALQGTAGYPTGREIYTEILQKAKVEDPNIISYLNDYNVLSVGTTTGGDYVTYKNRIQEIQNSGGVVDGIGFQAHMGGALIAPDSIYAILEDCHQTFSLPMKITEYDQSINIPDSTAGDYTADFLKIVFSHPGVNGFLTWGFWDGAHWNSHAPFFKMDWTPKPALNKFNQLVFNEWWTDSTLTTDASGIASLNGFKGDYRITVTHNGFEGWANVSLDNNETVTITLFPVSVNSILEEAVKMFPNPANDVLQLEMPSVDNWELEIINELGQTIQQAFFYDKQQTIDVQALASGIYFVKVMNEKGEQVVKKLIIE